MIACHVFSICIITTAIYIYVCVCVRARARACARLSVECVFCDTFHAIKFIQL